MQGILPLLNLWEVTNNKLSMEGEFLGTYDPPHPPSNVLGRSLGPKAGREIA